MGNMKSVAEELKRMVAARRDQHTPEAHGGNSIVPTASSKLAGLKATQFGAELRVASFNLWNVNPPMESRMRQIAGMIASMQLDAVGVQEVRQWHGEPQLAVLVRHLPGYAYVYQRAQGGPGQPGDEEGVGIVYRTAALTVVTVEHRILHNLPSSSDMNKRVVMRAVLRPSNAKLGGEIDFFVAHFSYDAGQQCESALEVAQWIDAGAKGVAERRLQILTGDFNIYFDFEWPMLSLTHPDSSLLRHADNPCAASNRQGGAARSLGSSLGAWIDVGVRLGSTFSNLDDARLMDPCRPDRVLVRNLPTAGIHNKLIWEGATFGGSDDAIRAKGQHDLTFPSDHRGIAAFLKLVP